MNKITIRFMKAKHVVFDAKPMRVRGGGKGAKYDMFATHKPQYEGGKVVDNLKDDFSLLGKITAYDKNAKMYFSNKKAVDSKPKNVLKSNSDLLTYAGVERMLLDVLNFNGYHANETLYGKKLELGAEKLRLNVNTMVRFDLPDGQHFTLNVFDIVVKNVYAYEAFRITDRTVVSKTKSSATYGDRIISWDGTKVIDQKFDSVITSRATHTPKVNGYYYNVYDIYLCGNCIRSVKTRLEKLIMIHNIS